jgi:hypothetical protein
MRTALIDRSSVFPEAEVTETGQRYQPVARFKLIAAAAMGW